MPCVSTTGDALKAALRLHLLGQPGEERLQHVCRCCGCPASRQRANASAVPAPLQAFFQLPCARFAYLGFSEQWDTARHVRSREEIGGKSSGGVLRSDSKAGSRPPGADWTVREGQSLVSTPGDEPSGRVRSAVA